MLSIELTSVMRSDVVHIKKMWENVGNTYEVSIGAPTAAAAFDRTSSPFNVAQDCDMQHKNEKLR